MIILPQPNSSLLPLLDDEDDEPMEPSYSYRAPLKQPLVSTSSSNSHVSSDAASVGTAVKAAAGGLNKSPLGGGDGRDSILASHSSSMTLQATVAAAVTRRSLIEVSLDSIASLA